MNINDFTIKNFNKHKPYIYLLIFEKETMNIYQSIESELVICRSSDINFKLVKVAELISKDNKIYFGINIRKNIIGYFCPKTSVIVVPKNVKQIRVEKNTLFSNELNQMLNVDEKYFEDKREKVAFSKHYASINNKIYESVVLKDEIIGFFESKYINNMHKVQYNFKVTDTTTLYRDNAMTKIISKIQPSDKVFKTDYIMPSENKLRFKHMKRNVWLDAKDTDLEFESEDEPLKNLDELLLNSIMTQYQEKLEDYHKYYNKVLNKGK